MASPGDDADTPDYEPTPRWGHAFISYNGLAYLVGGVHINLTYVDVFNPATLKWQQQQTSGDTPIELSYMAFTKVDTSLYFFGGGGVGHKKNNATTRLNLESLKWECLQPRHAPSPRGSSRMISDGERLYLLGGNNDRGDDLNDLHIFSINDGKCC